MSVQHNEHVKRPAPISLRLSEAERAQLEIRAPDGNVSAFIRSQLFGPSQIDRRREVRNPKADEQQVARVLAYLGSSEIAASMRSISAAATSGALPCTPETEALLREACSSIDELRHALLSALGLSERGHRT